MDLGVCVVVHCGSPRWLNSKTSKCSKAGRRQQRVEGQLPKPVIRLAVSEFS
jgi:hypothetical protein